MALVTSSPVRRGGNGGSRRTYGARVGFRKGWFNKKTGKTTSNQFVLTVDGEILEERAFLDEVIIGVDDEKGELVIVSVSDDEADALGEDHQIVKWRKEVIAKKDTGFKQVFLSEDQIHESVKAALEKMVDKSHDPGELYDVTEDYSDMFEGPVMSLLVERAE